MRVGLIVTALAALAAPTVARADAPAAPGARPAAPAIVFPERKLLSLEEAKRQHTGRLSRVVLEFLTVMDRVVNRDKQPKMTTADWAPLGELIDRNKFRRIGNYGVRNDWPSYAGLLTQWANTSWWKGYIWRMHEVPGTAGRPGLVYLETEERSNQKHPVRDDGDYSTLASIAVYEIDANDKITGLWVYDQRPL